jgi:hypothetical protein
MTRSNKMPRSIKMGLCGRGPIALVTHADCSTFVPLLRTLIPRRLLKSRLDTHHLTPQYAVLNPSG